MVEISDNGNRAFLNVESKKNWSNNGWVDFYLYLAGLTTNL